MHLLVTAIATISFASLAFAQDDVHHTEMSILRREKEEVAIQQSNETLPLSLSLVQDDRLLPSCSKKEKFFTLQLRTDDYGFETTWELKKKQINRKWKTIQSGPPANTNYAGNTRYTGGYCLSPGRYAIIIYDLFSDGLCCAFGKGEYAGYEETILLFSNYC